MPLRLVSPAGIGGRGLKRIHAPRLTQGKLVSPAGIGGRGLKQCFIAPQRPAGAGFARRYRRAWIETPPWRRQRRLNFGFARRYRRAWIETRRCKLRWHGRARVSPAGIGGRGLKRQKSCNVLHVGAVSPAGIGGRGLKLLNAGLTPLVEPVSPAGIGGRGLKPRSWGASRPRRHGFARRYRRAWIETLGNIDHAAAKKPVSPAGIGGRGLKPQHSAR